MRKIGEKVTFDGLLTLERITVKKLFPALTALFVLGTSCFAPALATSPSRGSLVLVPPLVKKGDTKSNRPMAVLRLPTQVGKVSKMVTTNLVSNSPSWIAKGDKYYSLCVPNRHMVACAPIVATSIMQDIDVGARAGTKGEPLITFKIAPGSKLTPQRFVSAVSFFLARTDKQVAHFNRKAVLYAPRPGATSLRVGPTSNSIDAGDGGGGCSYGDDDSYDCSGGDSGGGGYDGGGYEDPVPGSTTTPTEPTGQCEGNCDYPTGNNNGDVDPCADGSCPVVIIPGEHPTPVEPAGLPVCTPVGPNTLDCGRIPPVVGGEAQELPKGQTPWFPQSWCNAVHLLCSAGQEPDNDRGSNSSTSGKTLDQLVTICFDIWEVEMDVCTANRSNMDWRSFEACKEKCNNRREACRNTARELTDNGAHAAP